MGQMSGLHPLCRVALGTILLWVQLFAGLYFLNFSHYVAYIITLCNLVLISKNHFKIHKV